MPADEAQKRVNSTNSETLGNYSAYRYQAPNSIGSAQVDHILVKIDDKPEAEATYVDFATSVRGKSQSEYEKIMLDILETMEWEQNKTVK